MAEGCAAGRKREGGGCEGQKCRGSVVKGSTAKVGGVVSVVECSVWWSAWRAASDEACALEA